MFIKENGAVAYTTPNEVKEGPNVTNEDTKNSPHFKEPVAVFIQEGTDFNDDLKTEVSQKWDGTNGTREAIPDHIYANAPALLRNPCAKLVSPVDREVFLISGLCVISGILPNVKGTYRGRQVEANLFGYMVAPYGEGKGSIEYAKRIAYPIHQAKHEAYKEAAKENEIKLAEYNREQRMYQNDTKGVVAAPVKPTPPPHTKLFIPANNSKTGFYQLLDENGGRGILLETEGDTLAEGLKQEHGNFSDGLRNAFQHEAISFFRRTNNEDVEIKAPCISVMIASTFDQMLKLIPNIENGLYSRFLYYELERNPEFEDVFDARTNDYETYFDSIGIQFKKLYDILNEREQPTTFNLQDHQQAAFVEHFRGVKAEMRDLVSEDLGGTVNRLALITFRICMILSVLRAFEERDFRSVPLSILCSDDDFQNAIELSEIFRRKAIAIYWRLPKPKAYSMDEGIERDAQKIEQKKQCKALHSQGKSYRAIALEVLGSESKHQTAYRWIHS